ncbi:Uncharacterised protein [uncultured archaeon]|nr:Uncharacterised protein [uncultured archaeon]
MAGMQRGYSPKESSSVEYASRDFGKVPGTEEIKVKGRPVAKFRAGGIQVAIWENETKEGGSYKTVSIDRRYKAGEEWKSTKSFRQNDLPKAILALQKAFEYVSMKEDFAEALA